MTICGRKCYEATGSRCTCWCGGFFHGKRGEANRRLALRHFGALPRTAEEAKSLTLIKSFPTRQYFPARLLNG